MRQVEKIQAEVEVVKEILCDLCGNTTRILHDERFGIDQFSFAALKFSGGYGSPHDMTSISLELCEQCLFEIVNRRISGSYRADCCEIPPGVNAKEHLAKVFDALVGDNREENHEN